MFSFECYNISIILASIKFLEVTMEIIIPIIIVLIISILITLFFIRRKSKYNNFGSTNKLLTVSPKNELLPVFEEVSSLNELDKSKLIEIKDTRLIQRFIDYIPNAGLVINNINNANNYRNIINEGGKLYQAIIPQGAVLDKSKEIAGAYRASYRYVPNKYKGNANLMPVDDLANNMALTNVVNAGYNLAAMIVGQHYMAEIDAKLETISKDIVKIVSFQKSEYHSKVDALVAKIYEFSKFQLEILENNDLRTERIISLQQAKDTCTELLGQANNSIKSIIEATATDYNDYENKLTEANNWYQYQKTLFELLYRISELEHVFHLGALSKEHCYERCYIYFKQVENCREKLITWHKTHEMQFEIDIEHSKRKRTGIEGAIIKPIAWLINDEFNYITINEATATMIEDQTKSEVNLDKTDIIDLFQQDIKVIAKEGKLYYLPPSKE